MSTYLTTEFVPITCASKGCGVLFAHTRQYNDAVRKSNETWYCPNGHARHYPPGVSVETQLRNSVTREQALKDQLSAAIRDGEATRVAMVRDRQRFANGVCPCCNRSFGNVARHMRGEHPDYDVTKVKALPGFRCSCGRSFDTRHGLSIHQGRSRRTGWDEPNTSAYSSHLTRIS